jgi:two-component system sensor histidine kinase DegS
MNASRSSVRRAAGRTPNPTLQHELVSSESASLDPSTFLQLQEEERQRLAQALMAGPGQVLANALMEVEYSLPLLASDPRAALVGLTALRDELRAGLVQLKNYVAELQPPLVEEMGLGPGIAQYLRHFGEWAGIQTDCTGCDSFATRFPGTIEISLFRILQEALMNVQIHSKATRVQVDLRTNDHHVQMTIQDDGRGFAPRARSAPVKRQLGLIAMRDRAELLGGHLQLFSKVGHGVRVVATIPYHGHSTESNKPGGQEHYERTNHNRTRPPRTRKQQGQTGKGTNHKSKSSGKETVAKKRTRS